MSDSKSQQTATIGSVVKVKEQNMDEEEVFRLGTITKPKDNQVAPDNAMGQALLGAQPGDEVVVNGPTGPIKFFVIDVRSERSE
jgi:transcription elongation GreA/GreB family factor